MVDLVTMVCVDARLGIDAVALGEVEQRARADRDDELAGERGAGHAASIAPRALTPPDVTATSPW